MPLRPKLEELHAATREIRAKAKVLSKLSDAQLAWTPNSQTWPIAMVLDHLNKVHELTVPKFDAALATAAPAGADKDRPVKYGFFERVTLRMLGPNSPIPVPVPPIFEPERKANPSRTVVPTFFARHDTLAALIERSDAHDLKGLKASSPVSDKLKPGYLAYLEGTVQHEQYHWGQVEALLANPSFPK